jgi:hypothetical protein
VGFFYSNILFIILKKFVMAEFTDKWKKSFEKKYSKALSQIRDLEKEYQEMKDSNPDNWRLNYLYVNDSTLEFDNASGLSIYHSDGVDGTKEYVEIGVNGSPASSYSFKIYSLKDLIAFRNSLMESIDKFGRVPEDVKNVVDDDCEDEEGWEENEETEYTIQASRSCVQTWTHTVMARSSCEAYRKLHEDIDGSTHDENDEYDQYGEIDWEII